MRGVGDFRDEGLEGGELRPEDLPSGGEGSDGEGGGDELGEELRDLVESFGGGRYRRR